MQSPGNRCQIDVYVMHNSYYTVCLCQISKIHGLPEVPGLLSEERVQCLETPAHLRYSSLLHDLDLHVR